MRICAVMKYPPIQGGVSARCFWIARALAAEGHEVNVVTNSAEVEDEYRLYFLPGDNEILNFERVGAGSVHVALSGKLTAKASYVPYANPFVTKLAAMATEIIRARKCEVVFSYYFEPYAVGAFLASTWTRTPHVVQSAGSDRFRLMAHPEMSVTYKEILRAASVVVTAGRQLEGLGVAPERLASGPPLFLPAEFFNPEVAPLDVNAVGAELSSQGIVPANLRPFSHDKPTIGIYGKVGKLKGSYDLIAALAELRSRGRDFNLLAMIGGKEKTLFLDAIAKVGLAESTWTLPFLAHWRVPGFIRACSAVCFLERRFPIAAHAPVIPSEVMACGICLIVSKEIGEKQPFAANLRHGESVMLVEDPEDATELASVLEQVITDPDKARRIGMAGARLVDTADVADLGRHYAAIFERARHQARHRASPAVAGPAALAAEVAARMPATAGRLADGLAGVAVNFCERRGNGSIGTNVDAYDLGCFIVENLCAGNNGVDEETVALARFEREIWWLNRDIESPVGISEFPVDHLGPWRAPRSRVDHVADARPLRSAWIRSATFARSVVDVLPIENGRDSSVAQDQAEPVVFLFHKRGNLSGRVFRVNTLTELLLEACSGEATTDELSARFAAAHGINPQRVLDEIAMCAREGLVLLT